MPPTRHYEHHFKLIGIGAWANRGLTSYYRSFRGQMAEPRVKALKEASWRQFPPTSSCYNTDVRQLPLDHYTAQNPIFRSHCARNVVCRALGSFRNTSKITMLLFIAPIIQSNAKGTSTNATRAWNTTQTAMHPTSCKDHRTIMRITLTTSTESIHQQSLDCSQSKQLSGSMRKSLMSHSTFYSSFRGQFLQLRWPNQQRQSTEWSQSVADIPNTIHRTRHNCTMS